MSRKRFWPYLAALAMLSSLTVPAAADAGGEVLIDLDFDDGSTGDFSIYNESGGACTIANLDGSLDVDITSCGKVNYADQVYWDGFSLEQDGEYTYSFDVSSSIDRSIEYRMQLNGGDYHAYVGDTIEIGPDVQTVTVDFTMAEETDPAPRLCFNLGITEDMSEDPGEHHITFDNIKLVNTKAGAKEEVAEEGMSIKVNQIGYRTKDTKTCVVTDTAALDAKEFTLVNTANGEEVYTGTLTANAADPATNLNTSQGTFSEFSEAGTYVVKVGDVTSPEFVIDDGAYKDVFKAVVRMLYLQRCGTELTADLAGDFAHPECHTGKAVVYGTDTELDVTGGWHDAGDYGRYIVAGSKTVQDLFLAYEDFGLDADDFEIPESGNGVPDLLDEAKYELTWMLKMQDSETGGVYHKVTCASFPGFVMPEEETEQLILSPISTTATADFAAVMAKASVVYRPFDAAFADEALAAAKRAWDYVKDIDDPVGFKNPEGVVTGEYPDAFTKDEIFWAAAELYLAGDDSMAQAVIEKYGDDVKLGLGWEDMGFYPVYDLLKSEKACADEALAEVLSSVKAKLTAAAESIVKAAETDAFGMALGTTYPWGSNMTVADNAMLLMMAQKISGETTYQAAIDRHLAYLLGENGTGYSFVTGFGAKSPEHPHHRPSVAQGKAMPGMLSGGPDSGLDDPCAQQLLKDKAPALCWVDNDQSYSTNEITIYWNSPLIYVLAGYQK